MISWPCCFEAFATPLEEADEGGNVFTLWPESEDEKDREVKGSQSPFKSTPQQPKDPRPCL